MAKRHVYVVEVAIDETALEWHRRREPGGFLNEDPSEWNTGQIQEAVDQHVAQAEVVDYSYGEVPS